MRTSRQCFQNVQECAAMLDGLYRIKLWRAEGKFLAVLISEYLAVTMGAFWGQSLVDEAYW